eukprot:CAMPEP_0197289692 /NCGR_PEP_ID=MMETSP0890-20130614/6967_1 /TAXON_ID=44058 ORGANISM="Aureoumbra lagunensis, Strain CCMP1510" /NCGR_SAMPLE_ID=MMETSP0890 /ASSEMBLY_ACC=CAM_ASM_000533 /LENGTH=31 /DNA_ID= /DNA_START= /DNA_END= /DNA_ORIENTATION=
MYLDRSIYEEDMKDDEEVEKSANMANGLKNE